MTRIAISPNYELVVRRTAVPATGQEQLFIGGKLNSSKNPDDLHTLLSLTVNTAVIDQIVAAITKESRHDRIQPG